MPVIKGTSSISDDRVREKLLKKTKFPSNFERSVQFNKIHRPVIVKWIQDRLTELQNGVEDEIVQQMAVNLFLPPEDAETDFNARDKIQPKKAQLDLAGFLGDNEAAVFSKELWTLLLEAQESSNGIPPSLIERKKKELLAKQRSVAQPHSNVAPDPQMASILQEAQRRAQAARAVLERQQIQQWQRTMQQNQQQAFADPRGVPPLAAMPAPVGDLRGVPPMVVPPEEQKPSAEQVNLNRKNETGANIKKDLNDNDEDDDKTVDLNDDDDKTVDLNEREKSDKEGDKSEGDGRDKKRRRKSSDQIKVSDRRRDRKIRNDSPERKRGSKNSRRRDWENKHSDSNSDTSYNENGNVKQQNGKGNRDRGRKVDSGSDKSSSDRHSRSRSSSPERNSRGRDRRRGGKGYKRRYSSRSNSSASSRSISLSRSRSRSRSLSSSRSRRSRSLSSRSWSRSPSPSPRRERKKGDDDSINSERGRAKDNKRRRGENRDRHGKDEDRRNDRDRSETMKKRGDQYPDNRNSNHYRSRNRDRFGITAARDRLPGSGRGVDGSNRRRDADDPSRQHFSSAFHMMSQSHVRAVERVLFTRQAATLFPGISSTWLHPGCTQILPSV